MITKEIFVALLLIQLSSNCFSQIPGDLMIGINTDLAKSDNNGFLKKAQLGMEANYFLTRSFTCTGGIEVWTNDDLSAVIGARWYPVNEAFLRIRGLIGADDMSVGGGWTKPLKGNWKFEAIADFYIIGDISIRAGLTYLIGRKQE